MKWTVHADMKAMKPYMAIVDELKERAMSRFNDLWQCTRKKPQKPMYTKMYTIFRGKYGIVWHYKTPQQNIKSRFYGILERFGIV